LPGLDITPPLPPGSQLIQGYGDGGFRISGTVHSASVLVFPKRTVAWPVTVAADITLDSLAEVAASVEANQILVVGCGSRFAPPPAGLGEELREAGISLEWMDTGAACRTYNVLLIDDRAVTAALIAIS
jgi:uncharacterized protein